MDMREVDASGGDGINTHFGQDYLGAISVLQAPSECPCRYTGMPPVS